MSYAGSYVRHTPRQEMDIAVAGIASFLSFDSDNICKEARIALGAVAPTPVRAHHAEAVLAGRPLSDASIEDAAVAASKEARPISDIRASANYRREIVRVLTKRSLKAARERYLTQR
jgi:carbon-monoxide dehydrogenase medium subunit